MKTNVKRLSLALIALGLSAPAFADNCVMVPSQQGGFKIGIDALYLRATNSNTDYAALISFPSNFTAGLAHNRDIDPSYDWGFYAQVGYLFPCTGNDITVGYTYLRSDDSDSVRAQNPLAASGPVVASLPVGEFLGVNFADAASKSKWDLNVVDLEGGQRFTTGCFDMRMFAGLRYANIDHTQNTVARPFAAVTEGLNTTVTGVHRDKSDFRGIGPRLGVDGRYCLNSGFGIDANLSGSLLVGHVDSTCSAVATTVTTTTTVVNAEAKNGSRERVVPVLEAKLGVDYTHIIDCRCKSSIVFEAGYQVTNYFNTVDHPRILNMNATTAGTAIVLDNATTDLAFDGPYFGVKYYA